MIWLASSLVLWLSDQNKVGWLSFNSERIFSIIARLNKGAFVSMRKYSQYAWMAAISLSFKYITCLWRRVRAAFCFFRYSGSTAVGCIFFFLATALFNFSVKRIFDKFSPNIRLFIQILVYLRSYALFKSYICPTLGGALEAIPSQAQLTISVCLAFRAYTDTLSPE